MPPPPLSLGEPGAKTGNSLPRRDPSFPSWIRKREKEDSRFDFYSGSLLERGYLGVCLDSGSKAGISELSGPGIWGGGLG